MTSYIKMDALIAGTGFAGRFAVFEPGLLHIETYPVSIPGLFIVIDQEHTGRL